MKATTSTEHIDLNVVSPRMVAMIKILQSNSVVIDFLPAGSIQLHWGGKENEVHGKVVDCRLNTDDRE